MSRLAHLFDLSGRTALVTGGNAGIGLALARALGLAGAALVLLARRADVLSEAAQGLRADAIAAHVVVADLATGDGPDQVAESVRSLGAHIDIVVNAAGINLRQPFQEVTAEEFDRHLALHLRAPFRLTQLLAPAMAERGWGRIVNIASLQSVRAFANSAPSGAAKGGIVQLTRAIAEEWSPRGITCNAIAPGFFPTDLTAPLFSDPQRSAELAARTMIGRNGRMDDLHGAAVFLASDASGYITGQTLFVDGGFSAK
jgi:NAD(P)-dependent dehydrogenase (short-subunit alcohol dehydrogenase family)